MDMHTIAHAHINMNKIYSYQYTYNEEQTNRKIDSIGFIHN